MTYRYYLKGLKGSGSSGKVYQALDRVSGDTRAMKLIGFKDDNFGVPSTVIREASLLKEMEHDNIVKLLDVLHGDSSAYLIFDYMDCDLWSFMHNSPSIAKHPQVIKKFLLQILRGVAYCHSHKIIHRDLKPQKLLIDPRSRALKLAGFGLARAVDVPLKIYTETVTRNHYMAPEIMFGSGQYSTPVDVWSVGCIFGEMVTHQYMFGGRSEAKQLFEIFRIMGTPNEENWPGVTLLFPSIGHIKQSPPLDLAQEVPGLEPAGVDLLSKMLCLDPSKRITAHDALKHAYFRDV